MDLKLEGTVVFEKNMEAMQSGKYRYIINQGGSRSSKTTSLIQVYLILAFQEFARMTVWREKRTWNRASVWDDFGSYIKSIGLYKDKMINNTDLILRLGKSKIEFNGLDDYQKLHGLTQDYAWLNEAMEIKREDFDQIDMRTSKVLFIDFNPTEEEHWVYDIARQDDAILIKSTVLDNPFAPEPVVRKIKGYEPTPENIKRGTADKYKWDVYGLGNTAKKEGVIFKFDLIKSWPKETRLIGYGLDFGFYPDPSACVKVGIYDNKLVLDEQLYEHSLNYIGDTGSIEARLNDRGLGNAHIVADSAAKTGINELRGRGFRIFPVKKYAGSILDGIRQMQNYQPFLVTENSLNIKKELDNYTWQKDPRTDSFKDVPIDAYNHIIDGARYTVQEFLRQRTGLKRMN